MRDLASKRGKFFLPKSVRRLQNASEGKEKEMKGRKGK
jgi:hypothetical protein